MELFGLPSSVAVRRAVLDGAAVLLEAVCTAAGAPCPACGAMATRVHSRYVRRPMDLPWRGWTVRLALTVRRFRCDGAGCPRATFAEDVDRRLPRRARRTADVTALLLRLVNAAGGEQGARLAAALGAPTSPDTLLRLQRAADPAAVGAPRVLGVDDLALRRGQVYATLLVDMETRRPVDLLAGRDAATLASWLARHRGVEVVVRDRAGAYAEGAQAGAPTAVQVADRFHLLRNASEALDGLVRGRRRYAELAATDPPAPERAPSATKQYLAERRAARAARWERVRALRAAGGTILGIATELGMHRRTVRALLASPVPPRNRRRGDDAAPSADGIASALLRPYVPHVQERWRAGCTNAAQLFREITARGYGGSKTLLTEAVRAWRPPRVPRRRRRRVRLRWLCLRPPAGLRPDEQAALQAALAADHELATGHALLQRFRALIAGRDVAALDAWLADAASSAVPSFVALANGLRADRAAVEAALMTPWSNGPVEGHVHRVKLIKRMGYGRAKLDLLRARVLAA